MQLGSDVIVEHLWFHCYGCISAALGPVPQETNAAAFTAVSKQYTSSELIFIQHLFHVGNCAQ